MLHLCTTSARWDSTPLLIVAQRDRRRQPLRLTAANQLANDRTACIWPETRHTSRCERRTACWSTHHTPCTSPQTYSQASSAGQLLPLPTASTWVVQDELLAFDRHIQVLVQIDALALLGWCALPDQGPRVTACFCQGLPLPSVLLIHVIKVPWVPKPPPIIFYWTTRGPSLYFIRRSCSCGMPGAAAYMSAPSCQALQLPM